MADEPRRSGRATKGQHTKNVDEPEPTGTPPAKSKGKGKRGKSALGEQEPEEPPETIRCLCGENNDDDGTPFICCDSCDAWQHNACMGFPDKYNPNKYFCEQCKPESHADTMEALNAGEKPSVVAARNRKGPRTTNQRKGGRKSQSTRKSFSGEPAPGPAVPATLSDQSKRKQDADDNVQPSKLRKGSAHALDASVSKHFKVQYTTSTNAGPSTGPSRPAESLDQMENNSRKKVAETIKQRLIKLVKANTATNIFRIPDGDTADSLSERLAVRLENALFTRQGPETSEPYRRQTATIITNVPNNVPLALSFLRGDIASEVLATMSSSDMATDEQKRRDAKMKEENEKQAILVQEEGTRIRRTHKGEELVEDADAQFASESITSAAPPRRMLSHDEAESASAGADATTAGFMGKRLPPITTETNVRPASVDQKSPSDARRSSSNFNIQNVWSNIQSSSGGQVKSLEEPLQRPSGPGPISPQAADADIDRLLENDEGDDAPYSPVETSADPNLVWRGLVDMPIPHSKSIARFTSRGYHVAGADLGGREQNSNMFPADIVLAGRIASEAADHYLSSLSAARSTDVSVFELVPNTNEQAERAEFDKLFHYLHSRSRFGVIDEKSHRANVRDVYLVPLDEGAGPMPQFIQRLDQNAIESPRPRRMLLTVFVIRWKSPQSSVQQTPATPSAPGVSAMTPTAPGNSELYHAPAMPDNRPTSSSMSGPPHSGNGRQVPLQPSHSPQPPQPYVQEQQQYPSSFPGNPYGPSPAQQSQSLPQHTQLYPQHGSNSQHEQQAGHQLAQQFLGPYYDAPIARSLLDKAGWNMPPQYLQNMRRIFEQDERATTDMNEFTRILQMG